MNKIVNLTQHPSTDEQKEAGVFDLEGKTLEELKTLLTFGAIPSKGEIANRARKIAQLAVATGARQAMVGGAGFLISKLEYQLNLLGVEPVHAFSERVSEETILPDGSVKKTNVFKHIGFVRPKRSES